MFSSGRLFTADDVVAALHYLTGPLTLREVLAQEFDDVVGAQSIDPHTVEITLRNPDVIFPRTVSQLLIPDSAEWAELGPEAFALAPVGTGPFQVDVLSDEKASLSAFEMSWRPPRETGLEFLVLKEPATRLNGLLSDRLDIAFAVGHDDADLITSAEGSIYIAPLPAVLGLIFITTKDGSPLQSKLVRQALNYAVNMDAIINEVMGGKTVVASQPTSRVAFGYNPQLAPYGYDLDRAQQLLRKAGYPDGFEMTAEVTIIGPNDSLVFQKIADDLRRVGVQLTIQTIPYPTFASNFRTGAWKGEAFNLFFSTEPNLDALRGIRYHSCTWPAAWFCDQEIMPAIASALRQPDLEKRRAMTQAVMAHYREQAPAILLYEPLELFGLSGSVIEFSVTHSFIFWHRVMLAN